MEKDARPRGFGDWQKRSFALQCRGFVPFRQTTDPDRRLSGIGAACLCLLLIFVGLRVTVSAATQSRKMPVAPKWARFEHAFTSNSTYTNPLQEVTLTVQFTSPLGETAQVYGFWDGGRTWRVRFAPDQPGRWIFRTTCSDTANTGLNEQSGEFLCTSTIGQSPFRRHGRIQVAKDHHHFEHADHTPFFWLSDTVTTGMHVADSKSWATYAVLRSSQDFNVAQWAVAPGPIGEKESPLTGFPERIGINPDFFKALDAKLDLLREAGILSAICPLFEAEPQPQAVSLPDDQAMLLTRYVVARWDADPVTWLLAPGTDAQQIERWKKIGAEVFSGIRHAPVMVYSRQSQEVLPAFAEQAWADAFGFQMPIFGQEPKGTLQRLSEARPLVCFTPHENVIDRKTKARVTGEEVRGMAYCGLLMTPPAGVSYGGMAVENWDVSVDSKEADAFGVGLPRWHKALFMPGAKQLGQLAGLFKSLDFWRLRPDSAVLAGEPANDSAAVACPEATATKDLSVIYVAKTKMLELSLDAMPHSPTVTWFNPRQGGNSPAVAVVVQGKCQFPTPDAADWVLLLKAGAK